MATKRPMGIGRLGFSNLVFKRKFRFIFELFNICGNGFIPGHYVKVAARPKLQIEEQQLNFLNARKYVPGKGEWEPITVSYIDVATADIAPLYSWLASVYNFTNPITLEMGSATQDYTATGVLSLFDGCGQILERWTMQDVWPTNVDFGTLEYASSDEVNIELTLRYSSVSYEPLCPSFAIRNCCTPCG
jgi:hypothetical protein